MENNLWQVSETSRSHVGALMAKGRLPRPVALFLASHGVGPDELNSFFEPSLDTLSDPFLIPGIEKASERLWKAIMSRERILIHGDYDVDGITSSVLLQLTLDANGALTDVFIPHRFDDGYGFTSSTLSKAIASTGCSLVVTVDCGISSFDAVATAREKNIDIIITDHHEPQNGQIPDAYAVVNPKIHPSLSSLHILSGAGVCFKLCQGFLQYGARRMSGGDFELFDHLDIVCLGTVADIVPLIGENRTIVKHGLDILSKQSRPGIRSLCEISGLDAYNIKSSDITFSIAPRINAAGRLGDPYIAYKLLHSNSIIEAGVHSRTLNDFNKIRQNKEDQILNEAKKLIEETVDVENCRSIVISGKEWHQGVIGIVATRLVKAYNRPVVVFSVNNGEALGSARSVPDVNLIEILSKCAHVVERYGGHPMAAGIMLKSSRLDEFSKLFRDFSTSLAHGEQKAPILKIDGEIELRELDANFFDYLSVLEPFGQGNPQPLFMFKKLKPVKLMPAAGVHSRGILKDRNGDTISFIAFNRPVSSMPISDEWDVAATPSMNSYNNNISRQIQIHDARES